MDDEIKSHFYYKHFTELVALIKLLFPNCIIVALNSPTYCLRLDQDEKYIKKKAEEGSLILKKSLSYKSMVDKKDIIDYTPSELFGVPLKTIAMPIFNAEDKVIGGFVISLNIDKQINIKNSANNFFNPLNEIAHQISEFTSYIEKTSASNALILENLNKVDIDAENTNTILSYIEDTSFKTTLLGLNASVKSIKAGSIGACFDVISKEIMKLAKESEASVSQVSCTLSSIKTSIHEAHLKINSMNSKFQAQIPSVQEIDSLIEEITNIANELEKKIKFFY